MLSLGLIKHHAMKIYVGWRYSSTILDLGTRWRLVVIFTPCHVTHGAGWENVMETAWVPEQVWAPWRREKFLSPNNQPMSIHFTNWSLRPYLNIEGFLIYAYFIDVICVCIYIYIYKYFFPLALQPSFGPRPTSMKLSVSHIYKK
jgi:hypothetical protein